MPEIPAHNHRLAGTGRIKPGAGKAESNSWQNYLNRIRNSAVPGLARTISAVMLGCRIHGHTRCPVETLRKVPVIPSQSPAANPSGGAVIGRAFPAFCQRYGFKREGPGRP